jgi:hypothetical protein
MPFYRLIVCILLQPEQHISGECSSLTMFTSEVGLDVSAAYLMVLQVV